MFAIKGFLLLEGFWSREEFQCTINKALVIEYDS